MESIDIKGKQYITVNERLKEFARLYPNGSIQTSIIKEIGEGVIIKAIVIPDISNPNRFFVGHARELANSSFINKTSHIENCETSAIGRCLGVMGLGIDTSVASADEVLNAVHNQDLIVSKQKQLIKLIGDDPKRAKELKESLGIKHILTEMTLDELDSMISEAKGSD